MVALFRRVFNCLRRRKNDDKFKQDLALKPEVEMETGMIDCQSRGHLMHEKPTPDLKKLILSPQGTVYKNDILKVVTRIRVRKDLKSLKVQLRIRNISEHTDLKEVQLAIRDNPGSQKMHLGVILEI